MKKEKVLKKYFGHRKFRDGQSEIIDNILEGNKHIYKGTIGNSIAKVFDMTVAAAGVPATT